MTSTINWIAFGIAVLTSAGLLLQKNWRWGIGLLAVQYLCVFWLVQTHWPISMAVVKLVTGWMVCGILGLAKINNPPEPEESGNSWPQGRLFRILTSGIILSATLVLSLRASAWLGLTLAISWGSLLLVGMGLLQLGISTQPYRVVLGLLTILAGFEIIYTAVEGSIMVTGLLSLINLGLSLTGAYIINLSAGDRL